MVETSPENLLRLSAQIVSAHAAKNPVAADALPALIRDVHAALAGVGKAAPPPPERPQPAVPIRRSIQPDHLVCLEDGAKVTMLKRYIATRFGLTPDQYRARWELPRDYPMVAPDYARRRSNMAKELGLGRMRSLGPESAGQSMASLQAEPELAMASKTPHARTRSRVKGEDDTAMPVVPARKRGRPPMAKLTDPKPAPRPEQADDDRE